MSVVLSCSSDISFGASMSEKLPGAVQERSEGMQGQGAGLQPTEMTLGPTEFLCFLVARRAYEGLLTNTGHKISYADVFAMAKQQDETNTKLNLLVESVSRILSELPRPTLDSLEDIANRLGDAGYCEQEAVVAKDEEKYEYHHGLWRAALQELRRRDQQLIDLHAALDKFRQP